MSADSLEAIRATFGCVALSATEKLVLLCMAQHMNNRSGLAFPGARRVAVGCGLKERATAGAIRRLRSLGILEIAETGGQRMATYRVSPDRIREVTVAEAAALRPARQASGATLESSQTGTKRHSRVAPNDSQTGISRHSRQASGATPYLINSEENSEELGKELESIDARESIGAAQTDAVSKVSENGTGPAADSTITIKGLLELHFPDLSARSRRAWAKRIPDECRGRSAVTAARAAALRGNGWSAAQEKLEALEAAGWPEDPGGPELRWRDRLGGPTKDWGLGNEAPSGATQ